jgi:hypothetical protein
MSNPSKAKGDQFEWDLIALGNAEDGALHGAGLSVERTRAGYERDHGDILVLTADDQRLATLQAKNRRERKWSEWLAATEQQGSAARARFAALIVQRNGIGDVGRSYAITTVREHLRLLAALHAAEVRARVAEELCAALREQGIRVPLLTSDGLTAVPDTGVSTSSVSIMNGPDPDALADEPGTVRGRQVYPWRTS